MCKFNNSLDFEYTENYLALLACIISPCTADKAIRYLKIKENSKHDEEENEKGSVNLYNITNVQTGEVYENKTVKEISEITNTPAKNVSSYAYHYRKIKGIWKIQKVGSQKKGYSGKYVFIEKDGDVKEFRCAKDVAVFLKVSPPTINKYIKTGKEFNGYRIYYKGDKDGAL